MRRTRVFSTRIGPTLVDCALSHFSIKELADRDEVGIGLVLQNHLVVFALLYVLLASLGLADTEILGESLQRSFVDFDLCIRAAEARTVHAVVGTFVFCQRGSRYVPSSFQRRDSERQRFSGDLNLLH